MLQRYRNIADLRSASRRLLPKPIFEYMDGGAEDEISLRDSTGDYDLLKMKPKVLTDVSNIRRCVQIFGAEISAPIMISPTGLSGLYHPEGELAVARAANAVGIPYSLSTLSTYSAEKVAACTTGPKLLQVYIFKDRGLTRELVERAVESGYDGLIVTLDTPVGGNRERDWRNGMSVPPRLGPANILEYAIRPAWSLPALAQPHRFKFGNFNNGSFSSGGQGPSVSQFVNSQFDRSLTWGDIEWLKGLWGRSLAVKGILCPEDAAQAVKSGSDTVIVSNHGGRQLDGAVSPINQIGAVADKIGGSAAIVCDGGVRRGSHILKALAMGATVCSIGRPYIYGLAVGGEEGVRRSLSLLIEELDRAMTLAGVKDVKELNRSIII
ncbi:alpha-hydroxy acid oxidase [Pseudomonas kurunegalensis]|uniref:alpha-hydroxy acid oxidase n=1 Tax=Pseudomonas kurunegalensis TaxID=485880 RepID=UPI00257063CF|nr:alpha-hydroxy acid oxidase [Pseudomonas kurunegalensis]WJD65118.1 alpha-hydroxy acid oxidase [Pseudomonas kurunegalensis]